MNNDPLVSFCITLFFDFDEDKMLHSTYRNIWKRAYELRRLACLSSYLLYNEVLTTFKVYISGVIYEFLKLLKNHFS